MKAQQVLPGVWHVADSMGVCMTLLAGAQRALLVDTGYGLEDAATFVKSITPLPLTVILTHGHHDHALGARWFEESRLFEEDFDDFDTYTALQQRRRVAEQAQAKGLNVPQDYLSAAIPRPIPLQEGTLELGGLTAQVMKCPGHTPGSAVVYVPEHKLLLTADDWNPCTWLFFPKALGAVEYRANVRRLLELPFEHVLCSHQPHLYERKTFESFVTGLTDECLRSARKVEMGHLADTREASPAEGQIFVFDWNKIKPFQKES